MELEGFLLGIEVDCGDTWTISGEIRFFQFQSCEHSIPPHIIVRVVLSRSYSLIIVGAMLKDSAHFFGHLFPDCPSDQKCHYQEDLISNNIEDSFQAFDFYVSWNIHSDELTKILRVGSIKHIAIKTSPIVSY